MGQFTPLRVGLIGAAGRWESRAQVPLLEGVRETDFFAMRTTHENTARSTAEKSGVTGTRVPGWPQKLHFKWNRLSPGPSEEELYRG